jgi:5-methylcytosine-specific restriction endonuclease McrA
LAETRKKNAAKGREATKRWREANIEQARANGRAWYHANRDRALATAAAWKDANQDAKRQHAKAWRQRNPEKSRQQAKEWRELNPEWSRQNARRWREENPAKARAADANNRARRKAIEGSHSASDIQRLFAQQRGACAYCKASVRGGFHVDHIQPISKGGSNWPRNLQILCAKCNLTKKAKDPIDFAQETGRLL